MTQHTPGPNEDGGLYVRTGEGTRALGIAMNGRATNGGWMGISVAQMALPKDTLTEDQINEFAALFADAPRLREINAELLAALKEINALDPMEINTLNYNDVDLERLNTSAVEAALIARAAIAKAEGK